MIWEARAAERCISIHVPRAGDDYNLTEFIESKSHFNPRPPCGGRQKGTREPDALKIFQSTSPVRGTTFYPRHPYCLG